MFIIQVYLPLSRLTLRVLQNWRVSKLESLLRVLSQLYLLRAKFSLPRLAVLRGVKNMSFGIFMCKEDPT